MVSITDKAEFLNFWNREAVEFNTLHSHQIMFDEKTIFETFLYYKNHLQDFQTHNKATDFITSINGILTPIPNRDMLAISNDVDMDNYITRLEHMNQNNDWCIAYFGLHTINAQIWDIARNFAHIIYNNTDKKPTGRVDVDCFLGNYASTHSGVHVDYAHNFAFTLRNGKSMYTWSPNQKTVKGLKYPHYEQYKDSATIIQNRSDNICYFPYDYYHVAESKGATSLVVNIAFWEDNDDVDTIFEQVGKSLFVGSDGLNHIKFNNFPNHNFNSGLVSLSDDNLEIIHHISNRLNDFNIKLKIITYQLIKTTSLGLFVPRPIQKQKMDCLFLIKANNAVLQWIRLDDMLIISSNGHCSCISYHQDIDILLNYILNNEVIDIERCGQENIFAVINKLYLWGCLVCATR